MSVALNNSSQSFSVSAFVNFEGVKLSEVSPTLVTVVRSLSRVNASVDFQFTCRVESFLTEVTAVRFLSRVNAAVLLEVA